MGVRVLRGSKPAASPETVDSTKGLPSAADLDAVAVEESIKTATAPTQTLGGPTNPSFDSDALDSTGKNTKEGGALGPRGIDRPADVMSEDERKQVAEKHEKRLAKGMSSTHSVDSVGRPKGEFATLAQGHDKHGAKLPDKIDYSSPVTEHPQHVGPRGQGVPKDTFHNK